MVTERFSKLQQMYMTFHFTYPMNMSCKYNGSNSWRMVVRGSENVTLIYAVNREIFLGVARTEGDITGVMYQNEFE